MSRAVESLRVGDVMSRRLVTCTPQTPISAIGRRMAQEHMHCVVISGTEENGAREHLAWGIVSDTDLVRAAATGHTDATAGDVATHSVIAVEPNDPLQQAARVMDGNVVTHLVVVEPTTGRPVGVLSGLDIARAIGGRTASEG